MIEEKWIQHRGKRILYSELAGKNTEEILDEIARVKVEIRKKPPELVLSFINVKGGEISTEVNYPAHRAGHLKKLDEGDCIPLPPAPHSSPSTGRGILRRVS